MMQMKLLWLLSLAIMQVDGYCKMSSPLDIPNGYHKQLDCHGQDSSRTVGVHTRFRSENGDKYEVDYTVGDGTDPNEHCGDRPPFYGKTFLTYKYHDAEEHTLFEAELLGSDKFSTNFTKSCITLRWHCHLPANGKSCQIFVDQAVMGNDPPNLVLV
eukprot:gnl/MRDRNA2_/MRDRNA2_17482_c0_seq1.p1 gnl/MRDRNA2_/MRDRNA2_17482_c0~~gnl/MRDRNA2_/MRDRNA2_17482_c0_seq1.p1  ORF type:complete len:157 (-),score=26.72 gnl/MRDRNA2_/MRDRNA2_17482_c0_seq1:233-703(-)